VKYLVDNAEMFFVPIVNPDGYVYNETTAPNGGGMWRKNRRNNGDGTFGVDLNRNYSYNWGANNTGSSPNTGNDTYRGPSAASEPETKNMETFCNQHTFKIATNYHTYGNLLIYPWGGGTPAYTIDSAQYTTYGAHLTSYNHWSYGTAAQTVLYTTNGTSDDWMYGEQISHPKIMAMTPEAGKSDEGFWPPNYRIIPICQDAVWTNLHICHLALKYAVAKDNEQNYISNLTGYFNYKLQRLGMDGPSTYSVSIIPISSAITSVGATKVYSSLSLMQEESDSISYTLSGATPNGQLIKYVITVDNGSYIIKDTIVKRYGKPVIVFSSKGNSMTGWSSTTGWGISTAKFHSSPSSITDSPSGNYGNSKNTSIHTTTQLDLSNAISAQLSFWGMWDIETNRDYLEVQASNDNGSSWIPLCGKFTKNGNGNQDPDQPLYDAFIKSWLYEEMPLDDYIGQKILIRFNLITDNAGSYDGFYFDDLKVEKIVNIPQGINENLQNDFVLSQNMPNPARNEISIAYSLPSTIFDASLEFFNSIGELVKEEKLNRTAGIAIVDISSFAKGIYFYRIKTEKLSSSVLKMVVINE
ncbi:MAG: immune inhibitor A, partial [Bacteroidetes bacterium]|nr:immune inhibitor A [Bacteroidota bacterium]